MHINIYTHIQVVLYNTIKPKTMKSPLLFTIIFSTFFFFNLCLAVDGDNIWDTCPTSTQTQQTIFFNGLPCKNPSNITASDFKSSKLNQKGDTHNFLRSSQTIITAMDFPGLNTLGLSIARTDLEIDGLIMPHSHPRASELFFVSKGVVLAGFIDSNNKLFQKLLREGDVFVLPRGLLHYSVNSGFENATVFSVLNSQNPGLVSISNAMFGSNDDSEGMEMLVRRVVSLSKLEMDRVENVALSSGF